MDPDRLARLVALFSQQRRAMPPVPPLHPQLGNLDPNDPLGMMNALQSSYGSAAALPQVRMMQLGNEIGAESGQGRDPMVGTAIQALLSSLGAQR